MSHLGRSKMAGPYASSANTSSSIKTSHGAGTASTTASIDPASARHGRRPRPIESSSKTETSSRHGSRAPSREPPVRGKLHKLSMPSSSAPGAVGAVSAAPSASTSTSSAPFSSGSALFPTISSPISAPAVCPASVSSRSATPSRAKTTAATKIKPLIRKLTTTEPNTLDLSKSGLDASGGLGVAYPDLFAPVRAPGGARHHRSTSATSQFSTATAGSANRPYVHPKRQVPRPFTPPAPTMAHPYTSSRPGSELSADGPDIDPAEEERLRQILRSAAHARGGPLLPAAGSSPTSAPLLRLDTTMSGSRLTMDSQHPSRAGTPSTRRRRGTMSTVGTTSPLSRSSIEGALRLRRRDSSDPASRAESLRAARQAFSEREAAKALRAEKDDMRRLARQERRDRKRDQRRHAPAAAAAAAAVVNEKLDPLPGTAYAHLPPSSGSAEPPSAARARKHSGSGSNGGSAARPPKTAQTSWMGFVVWLKTRIFKLGRRFHAR
ncbi:MAG: hypothetical protein M1826_001417 [Phylliscum demangeonii]|nr:MAG: hypothetical protein M1826_001417 [Phylliscum demangeonii]